MRSTFMAWLGRMSVGRKLMLIYLLDLTAVIYVSGILIQEKLEAIAFTQREVVGAAYTDAVRANLTGVLLPATTPGGAPEAATQLANMRRQHDDTLQTTSLANAWVTSLGQQAVRGQTGVDASHHVLAQQTRMLLTAVANQSNLILDPDLDSYYVMSLVSLRYPELLQLLVSAQGLVDQVRGGVQSHEMARLASVAAWSAHLRVELLTVAGQLEAITQGIASDQDQARKAGNDTLRAMLDREGAALLQALEAYQNLVRALAENVAAQDGPAANRTLLALDAGQQIERLRLNGAWQEGLVHLRALLVQREQGLYTRMAVHLGTALALLLAVLGLVYLVASQISRPLRHLATVAERVRETTDYSRRAQWTSSDEIGRLCDAFNDMLTQLDRDRLVQQELAATARASKAQQALLEASPIALMVTSVPDHEVLHLNAPARPWLGGVDAPIPKDPWRTGLEPGVRARFFQRLADRDQVDEFEVRWRGGSEPSWAVLSARRLVYQGREAVLTSFTPINVLKMMEQRLELWAKVFEASSEGITIMNAQFQILSVNAAFCRSTGYEFYEVLGEDFGNLIDGGHPHWKAGTDLDSWQGEVRFRRQSGESYPAWLMVSAVREGGSPVPTHHIGIAIDITDRKAKEERIRFLAQHDVLTELPNRALCQIRLAEALAAAQGTGEQVAVLFIDLDRFKLINDTLGHHIGDGLLRTVARRLAQTVRAHDTVSRLGGDEFVIVMRRVSGRAELDALVHQRLIPAIRQPMEVEGHTLNVSCSVGVAMYPGDATDQDELMRRADAAMYEAKSAGRDTARYFSAETDQRVLARQAMETQLRTALANQEFSLHFQPRLGARQRKLRGAEALLRWNNPTLGQVPPGVFIQLAEETGLIKQIGPWVLEQACQQWVNMGQTLPALAGLQLSVNLSAAQLADGQLVTQVRGALQRTGLPAAQLELELTESHLMDNPGFAQQQVSALKELGVQVSIDDFGTGYSSLAYLKRFEIDKLKVDQSFVRGMLDDAADAAIVQAVIGLGHTLNLKVVAEGVETMPTAQALTALGCDELQGYGFGRPMPEPQFLEWAQQTPCGPDRRG
jgi:diguanylate cyclase (GGDEF)-like protein/PAS domain S-box-containing protein